MEQGADGCRRHAGDTGSRWSREQKGVGDMQETQRVHGSWEQTGGDRRHRE